MSSTTQADILFYQAKHGSFTDWIIVKASGGLNIVHTAIDMGDRTVIEANGKAIVRRPYNTRKFIRWSYSQYVTDIDAIDMQKAISWLTGMLNQAYGWQDIFTAANLFQKFFYIVMPLHYDCSALSIEFLRQAGGVRLGDLEIDPHRGTPAGLFRQFQSAYPAWAALVASEVQ